MLLTLQKLIHVGQGVKPVCSTDILAGDVFTIHGDVRRRRPEITLAVQGESVQLFDVCCEKIVAWVSDVSLLRRNLLTFTQIGRTRPITNYALPPQERFTCPPTSIRYKCSDGSIRRVTYVSVAHSKGKIHSWTERLGRTVELREKLSKTTWTSSSIVQPIVWIGAYSLHDWNEAVLLVVHQDGVVRLISEDLRRELWHSFIGDGLSQIRDVFMLSIEQVKKGFLKDEEDLLARLQAINASNLLVIVTRRLEPVDPREHATRIFFSAIHTRNNKSALPGMSEQLETLLAMGVPEPECFQDKPTIYQFNVSTGALIQCAGKAVAVFLFRRTFPKLAFFAELTGPISSCVPLAKSTIAISQPGSVIVIDIGHGSVRGSVSTNGKSDSIPETPNSSILSCALLSYFASLGAVLAFNGKELIAIHVHHQHNTGIKKKGVLSSSLAQAMGRGLCMAWVDDKENLSASIPTKFGDLLVEELSKKNYEETKKRLHHLAKEGNQGLYDEVFEQFQSSQKLVNFGHTRLSRDFIHKVISDLFFLSPCKGNTELQYDLQIRLFAPRTLHWLANHGFITRQHIQFSLKHTGKLPIIETLSSSAVIDALYRFDPSLQTLSEMLVSLCCHLSIYELGKAIFYGLESLNRSENMVYCSNLLSNKYYESLFNEQSNPALGQVHKHHGYSEARILMQKCISYLSTFPLSDIRVALESSLPRHLLLSLISFLRLEIASGGWLSPYSDVPIHAPNYPVSSDYCNIVAFLINISIDGLGATTWMSSDDEQNSIAYTVSHMKAEVGAALEGAAESAYLQGVLHEVLMFSKNASLSLPGNTRHGKRKREMEIIVTAKKKRMIKPTTIQTQDGEKSALPVGLKQCNIPNVQEMDTTSGKKYKQSTRDIGRLKSMQVGAYTFERIGI